MEKSEKTNFTWKELARSAWFLLGLGGVRKRYVAGLIILFLLLTYAVVPPLIIGIIVNFFAGYSPGSPLGYFYILLFVLAFSMIIVSLLRLTSKEKLGLLRNITVYQIGVRGFEILLSQSLLENSEKASGEKLQMVRNGIDSFRNLFGTITNQILQAAASLAGVIAIFIFLRPVYALFFLAYAVAYFISLRLFTARLQRLNFEKNKALERSSGAYVEGLNNITALKSAGSEKSFQIRIIEKENITKGFMDKITRTGVNQWKTFQTLNGISVGLFLFIVGKDVMAGTLNIGQIVTFYSYLDRLMNMGSNVMDLYSDLIESKAGIGTMMGLFKKRMEDNDPKHSFPEAWKELKIIDGSFRYKSRKGLENINLVIRRGERLGIVGETGSGKSTLSRVLLGLYRLESGEYRVNSSDFYSIRPEGVFENISVVPQEVEIFNMSLRENITLFRETKESFLEKAIEVSQLRKVVSSLSRGLDTVVGEKGYQLSGGERQRLAIARAICQNSQILILDEATSSLDTKTEKLIYEALEKNFPEKTIVAIAHRTNTLENFDRIYVLKDGKIVNEGNYKEFFKEDIL